MLLGLKARDLEIVGGAYSFFVRRGEVGTEELLIEALNKHANVDMVTAFYNCGNEKLREAAESWVEKRGLSISPYEARGGEVQTWGDRQ
jgi:hypothetical protein